MNIEEFFLKEYEILRERVKELESELERQKPSRYGIVDLGESQELVKVSTSSSYSLYDKETKAVYIEKVMQKDDDELLAWAKNYKLSYYDHPIEIEHKTFPFTVQTTTFTSVKKYATDGCSTYVQIDYMEENMVDNLGEWCLPEFEEALVNAAIGELREQLAKTYRILEKCEQEGEQ